MPMPGGRAYLVEGTVREKALRRESTWVSKGHKGGQCDWSGGGREGGGKCRQCGGRLCRAWGERWNRNKHPQPGCDVPCSLFGVKPSGRGLLGNNPKSDRGLRVSGLAAMGAQVF